MIIPIIIYDYTDRILITPILLGIALIIIYDYTDRIWYADFYRDCTDNELILVAIGTPTTISEWFSKLFLPHFSVFTDFTDFTDFPTSPTTFQQSLQLFNN